MFWPWRSKRRIEEYPPPVVGLKEENRLTANGAFGVWEGDSKLRASTERHGLARNYCVLPFVPANAVLGNPKSGTMCVSAVMACSAKLSHVGMIHYKSEYDLSPKSRHARHRCKDELRRSPIPSEELPAQTPQLLSGLVLEDLFGYLRRLAPVIRL